MVTLDKLHKEIIELRMGIEKILEILEEYELTEDARKALEEARATPEKEYIPHEAVRK